ncbi:UDP-N-acetylmuramyl-tripeptide synthetase [Bienertia sinuspersici]
MNCMIGEIGDIIKDNKHKDDSEKMTFALIPFLDDSNYLQTLAPGGEARRAPTFDREVIDRVLKTFDKLGENEEEKRMLRQQLAKFQAKEGFFGSLAAKFDVVTMPPISW